MEISENSQSKNIDLLSHDEVLKKLNLLYDKLGTIEHTGSQLHVKPKHIYNFQNYTEEELANLNDFDARKYIEIKGKIEYKYDRIYVNPPAPRIKRKGNNKT